MGFPVPGDAIEQSLDLNQHLIPNPAATFFMEVDGDTQTDGEVQSGDLLVVDRSQSGRDGSLIVAVIQGELTVLRVQNQRGDLIPLVGQGHHHEDLAMEIWGVVTTIIRRV